MMKFCKFIIGSFWPALVLIMILGQFKIYGGEQLPDNIVDTALKWINQTRVQEGLEILSIDPRLNRVAEAHSKKMAEYKMLSDSNPALETPFERVKTSGLTDTNNLVAVAMAKTWSLLQGQLKSSENFSKLLSPEMTHVGVGIETDSTGDLWLTVHMSERAINFTQFTLSQPNTYPAVRSIIIKGNTLYEKVKVILIPPEGSNPSLAVDRYLAPDSDGDFEIPLSLGTVTGSFGFEFFVEKNGAYILKNLFEMDVM